MSYFQFLGLFVGLPIIVLLVILRREQRPRPTEWTNMGEVKALAVIILLALIYTTPWDNYLVATGVWWYDPNLVTGLTIGWVPIEEYTFFIVQPIMTGLWLFWLQRRWPGGPIPEESTHLIRPVTVGLVGVLWLTSVTILASGWRPGTYLGLEFGWALLPILLQLAFGADILWRHRNLVLAAVGPTTIYLSLADSVAIAAGTWTIAPGQSTGILLGGVLPIEEFFFFLLTNMLVVFGLVLFCSQASARRLVDLRQRGRLILAARRR